MKLKTKNNKPQPLPIRTYRRDPTSGRWMDEQGKAHKLLDLGYHRVDLVPLTK